MTSVCRSCIIDSKIDQDLFKDRGLVLSKFIARKDNLELETKLKKELMKWINN